MYYELFSFLIHMFGIFMGFVLSANILPKIEYDNEPDVIPFEYLYIDELEALLELSQEETPIDKSNIVKMNVPGNEVIMFYDPERSAFCYYTRGDVLYKILNTVCRKYVIDYNCPSLYFDELGTWTKEETESNPLFIKKIDRPILQKNINKFILCGSLEDYYKCIPEEEDIDIIDFLSLSKDF